MATRKGDTEQNNSSDERMSESESDFADTVNPLYSLASSKSDHSSLGRVSIVGDQAADDSTRALRSASCANPDDTTSDVRSSDFSRTGASSSSSLPSVSQVYRPPQSAAVSEEQQQVAAVKAPPPPVVPVRLVRAPSSARPATNIPKYDCPEKIVSSLYIGIFLRLFLKTMEQMG